MHHTVFTINFLHHLIHLFSSTSSQPLIIVYISRASYALVAGVGPSVVC